MSSTSISASSTHVFEPATWLTQFSTVGGAFALTDSGLHLWIVPGDHSVEELSQARRLVSRITPDQRAALKDHLGAQVGESSSSPSPTARPPRSPAAAGDAGAPKERTDDMNMMTAIRATTALTALDQDHRAATPIDTSDWEDLMASYLAAKQVEDDYAEQVWNPAYEREQAFVKASGRKDVARLHEEHPEEFISSELNDEMERLTDIRCHFEDALVVAPAPHADALRWKLDYLLGDRDGDGSVSCWNIEFVAQTVEDYRRILSAPSTGTMLDATRQPDTIDLYWQAFHAFNADQFDEGAYMEAFEDLHDYRPASDRDFVRKFEAAFAHGGAPDEDRLKQLVGEASALLGADSRALLPVEDATDASTDCTIDIVGPDLSKARPIEEVIQELAPLRNNYPTAFYRACKDSGIDVTVTRDDDGVDHLMMGCPADGQEDIRLQRLDALGAQLRRGAYRRQSVIDALNLAGQFVDNQRFGSIEEAANSYIELGGRIYVLPDGRCAETVPYDEVRMEAEYTEGFPLRRMLQRYKLTLTRNEVREAMANYVRTHGVFHEGSQSYVLEGEGNAHG